MPTKTPILPRYCRHRPTDRAYVRLHGRMIYLGKWGSPESKAEYDAVVARWLADGRRLEASAPADLAMDELMAAYLEHAQRYHADADGKPTPRIPQIQSALTYLHKLYGNTLARDFGPVRLHTLRQTFIGVGWSRRYVNYQIHRVRAMFRWGVEHELVPAGVLHGLQAVGGLRKGRGGRETPGVKPLPDDVLESTLKYVPPMIRAMVRLQRVTGMRSGEVTIVRGMDLDLTGLIWLYAPATHKTAYREHPRTIAIGPRGQEFLRPWLVGDPTAFVFSPARSMELVRAARTTTRRTPLGQGNRVGTNRRKHPAKSPGERYSVASYRRALHAAADVAFPPPDGLTPDEVQAWRHDHRWGPHRLRHAYATEARRAGFGLEIIRAALGHRSPAVTAIYAEIDTSKAAEVALRIG